jgi:hypothetical protein
MTDLMKRLRLLSGSLALHDLDSQAMSDAVDELQRMQSALELKEAARRQLDADVARLRAFVKSLLDPDFYGHAVTAEIRDAARVALGMPASETAPPPATAESFNEDTAKRDAIAFRAVPYPRSRR